MSHWMKKYACMNLTTSKVTINEMGTRSMKLRNQVPKATMNKYPKLGEG